MPKRHSNPINDGTGAYPVGLFECFNCNDCEVVMKTMFFFVCYTASLKSDLDGSNCMANTCCFCLLCVPCSLRSIASNHYDYPSFCCEDCLTATFCTFFSTCQVGSSIKYENQLSRKQKRPQQQIMMQQAPTIMIASPAPTAQRM